MKVMLLNPPMTYPLFPPASLSYLTGYLSAKQVAVKQVDASIDGIHYLLTPDRLARKLDRLQALKSDPRLALYVKNHCVLPANQDLANVNIAGVSGQVERLYTVDGFSLDPRTHEEQFYLLNDVLVLFYLDFFPNVPDFQCADHLSSVALENNRNPFHEYYQEVLYPAVVQYAPDLVGISYSFFTQFYQTYAISLGIRHCLPRARIVVGGSGITNLHRGTPELRQQQRQRTFAFDEIWHRMDYHGNSHYDRKDMLGTLVIDYGVFGEGEQTLLELCASLDGGSTDSIGGA